MKKLTKKETEWKRDLNTMAREVRRLPPSVFENEIVLQNIQILRRYGGRIENLVRKHHGIVYGSALFTDRRSINAGFRKTDDLDVVFLRKTDMLAFQTDVIHLLGQNYMIYHGKWGDSVINRRTKEKLIDMHVNSKYKRSTALEHAPRYVRGGKAATKKYSGGIAGDDPRVAVAKKANAAAQSLIDNQTWRIEKDLWDLGRGNRAALDNAKRMIKSTKNEKQRKDLQRIVSRYEKAMLSFSADPKVSRIRKTAEKKYIKEGIVTKPTFTDMSRMRDERKAAKTYGIVKSSPKKRSSAKRNTFVNFSKMI